MTSTALIGSSSFLASYFIADLEKESHSITLFSRVKKNHSHLFSLFAYPDNIPDYSVFLDYDVVIYAAAGGVQSSKKYSVDEIFFLNAFLPISLSNFLDLNNFKGKLITFGSYFEIGAQNKLKRFTESDVALSNFDVPNHYCVSKRLLSRFVNDSISSLNHYHLILPSVYGKNENEKRLIPYIISSLQNQKKLELTAGNQVRQFLHARDVSEFVMMICNKSIEKGVYNLSTENDNLVKDVVEIVFNYFGKDFSNYLGSINKQDEDMQVLLLDNSKSIKTGWKPKIDLNEGVLDYFNN
jgi:nucleoside-diphosphate-sugar epimerase